MTWREPPPGRERNPHRPVSPWERQGPPPGAPAPGEVPPSDAGAGGGDGDVTGPGGAAGGGDGGGGGRSKVLGALTVVGLVLVGLGALGLAAFFFIDAISDDSAPRESVETVERPDWVEPPEAWDPWLEPIAMWVSNARGLDWVHPVHVHLLDEEAFVAEYLALVERGDEEFADYYTEFELTLNALDLFPVDVDLRSAMEDEGVGSVGGWYDPETGEIFVRGDQLTPSIKGVVAHEFTHALQDQHHDLLTLQVEADERGNDSAIRSVIEGDAVRIQIEYLGTLTDEELAEAAAFEEAFVEAAEARSEERDLPPTAGLLNGFPYVIGPGFVMGVADTGVDATGVDDLFIPDVVDTHVLQPPRWFEQFRGFGTEAPDLPDGAEQIGEPTRVGALTLFLALAARIDALQALEAVDGWGGDAAILYRVDDVPCIGINLRPYDVAASERLQTAIESWIAAGPPDAASLELDGNSMVWRSCALGSGRPANDLIDAAGVPGLRSYLFGAIKLGGTDRTTAWCMAREMTATAGGLLNGTVILSPEEQAQLDALVIEAYNRCT